MHTRPTPGTPRTGSRERHVHRIAALFCALAAALLLALPDPDAVYGAGITLAIVLPSYVIVIMTYQWAPDPTAVSRLVAWITGAALVVCFLPILLAVIGLNAAVSAVVTGAPPNTGAALSLLLTALVLLAVSFQRSLRPGGSPPPSRPTAPGEAAHALWPATEAPTAKKPSEADGLGYLVGGRAPARPLSRTATALAGAAAAGAGLHALTLPYAMFHLAAVFGTALAAFLMWANLRFDRETPRGRLLVAIVVGFLGSLKLSPYLRDFAVYLFEQLAPQVMAAAPGDIATAALCGLVALVCWTVAATGAGGLHPPTDPDPA